MSSPSGRLSQAARRDIGMQSYRHDVSRTMTITRAEFLRSLSPLKQHYRIDIDKAGGEVEISHRTLRVALQLHDNSPLRLGSLNMSSLRVEFSFKQGAVDEIGKFWSRFDLCFRRGGG